MKAVRILQIIVLLAVSGYLLLLHNNNPDYLVLPFLLPLPPSIALLLTLVLGWLAGWAPAAMRAWRRERDLRRLRRRVAELEQHVPSYDAYRPAAPVIPDRPASVEEEAYPARDRL